MKCFDCGKDDILYSTTATRNGGTQSIALCSDCFKKEKEDTINE